VSIGIEDRVRALEVQVATTKADLLGHIVLCDGRMKVLWKVAGGLSAIVAAVVSLAIAFART
jgi:hypothetical protein